jgi:hypothetical protein
MTTPIKAREVQIGDRLRTGTGLELTVTRIDHGLLGRPEFLSFVEDSAEQWLKLPAAPDGEIELVDRPSAPPAASGGPSVA